MCKGGAIKMEYSASIEELKEIIARKDQEILDIKNEVNKILHIKMPNIYMIDIQYQLTKKLHIIIRLVRIYWKRIKKHLSHLPGYEN